MKKKFLMVVLVMLISMLGTACGILGGQDEHSAVIVIGEDENRDLAERLKEAMGKSAAIVKDTEKTKAATEILIGKTNRQVSIKASEGLREGDGWIRFYEGSVVIQGSNSEKLEKMVNYFSENFVPAWQDGENFPTDRESNYFEYGRYALQALSFDDTEIYEYSIVTKDGAETQASSMIQQHVEAMSSYKLPIISSSDLKEGQKAIIFGSSEARESAAKCKELKQQEFLMKAEDDSLYLCAWNASEESILAYMFLGETAGCQLYNDIATEPVVAHEDYNFKFTTAFDGSGKFKAMCTQVANFPVYNEFNVLQGCCSDGTYFYLIMQTQIRDTMTCVIEKVDPATWEIVQVSDPLPVDHGNSITYLPDTNQLVIANCMPDPKLVSWVAADTLKYIRTEKIPYNASSLSWSQARQQYAIMGANKSTLIADAKLGVTDSYNGLASNYTNQGYVVDDDYIYIISNSGNAVHVCDWEGHWIESISIPVGTEMESMIHCEDSDLYYTTFLSNGADIFATVFYRRVY